MRQKCVRNASKCVKMGLVLLGQRGTFQNASDMRQNCVKNASKMRGTPLGENTFWTTLILGLKSGELLGSLGNFQKSQGNFRGSSGLLLSSTVSELPGKSPKNFQGSSGNFREVGDFPEARRSLTPSQRFAKFVSKKI